MHQIPHSWCIGLSWFLVGSPTIHLPLNLEVILFGNTGTLLCNFIHKELETFHVNLI
jgi:hypothetical protein